MATAAEDIQNNPDPGQETEQPNDQQLESNGDDSPYAPLAKDMGWTPRDQFQGDPAEWKDAETFIRVGREIQRETSRELKSVREQLDAISRTTASIVEQTVQERVAELTQRHAQAVEDGDSQEAFKIAREIDKVSSATAPAARGPSAEAQAFAERNANWFNKPGHEYATARAVEICNMLQGQGYTDHGAQLRIAEQRLRQEMPELFGQQKNGKPAPQVNSPASRGAPLNNRAKGFADMPKAAQDIANDMVDRGVIKSVDDYARNYFANLGEKK